MRAWRAVITLLCALAAGCASTLQPDQALPVMQPGQGWHEAVVSVRDIETAANFFKEVAGWQQLPGKCNDTIGHVGATAEIARCAILHQAGSPGWVRLIEYENVLAEQIRPHAQSWDSGGIFSLMTRGSDLSSTQQRALTMGYNSYNTPYTLEFSGLSLKNGIIRGPDGLNLAIYEWVQPKRDDVPAVGVAHAFNSMQMVADLAASRAFYLDVLGYEVIMEGTFIDEQDRPTNFGLPVNYATKIPRHYAILKERGAAGDTGRIELMQFEGFTGRDFSNYTPTQQGIVALRIPVADLDARHTKVTAQGKMEALFGEIDLWPWGRQRAFSVRAPEGTIITYFQATSTSGNTR